MGSPQRVGQVIEAHGGLQEWLAAGAANPMKAEGVAGLGAQRLLCAPAAPTTNLQARPQNQPRRQRLTQYVLIRMAGLPFTCTPSPLTEPAAGFVAYWISCWACHLTG